MAQRERNRAYYTLGLYDIAEIARYAEMPEAALRHAIDIGRLETVTVNGTIKTSFRWLHCCLNSARAANAMQPVDDDEYGADYDYDDYEPTYRT